MAAGNTPQPPPTGDTQPAQTFTLDPFLNEAEDALTPLDTDDLLGVKLRQIDLAVPNAYHQVTTKSADDLFRCAKAVSKRATVIPYGAELLRAVLAFFFPESPFPHIVEIIPPFTIRFQFPADAARILKFLASRGFIIAKAANLIALLLAIMLALSSALADTDYDDDDDLDPRHTPHRRSVRVSHHRPNCLIRRHDTITGTTGFDPPPNNNNDALWTLAQSPNKRPKQPQLRSSWFPSLPSVKSVRS